MLLAAEAWLASSRGATPQLLWLAGRRDAAAPSYVYLAPRDAAAPVARGSKLACSLLVASVLQAASNVSIIRMLSRAATLVVPAILVIVELDKSTA